MSFKKAVAALGVTPTFWLRHDETAGALVAVDETEANSFSINGSPTFGVTPGGLKGSPSKATKLAGIGDYFSIIDEADVDFGDKFTFFFHVRRDALENFSVLTEKGEKAPLLRWNESDKLEFRKFGSGQITESTTAVKDTTAFNSYMLTKDGATVKLYQGVAGEWKDVTGSVSNKTCENTAERLILGEDNEGGYSKHTFAESLGFKGVALSSAQGKPLYDATQDEAGGKEEQKELEEAEELREQQEAEWAEYWPPAGQRPFSSKAPVNTFVGSNPTIHPDSDEVISKLLAGASSDVPAVLEVHDNGGGGEPTFYAREGDPERSIELTDEEKYGGGAGVKAAKVKAPNTARPEGLKAWTGDLKDDFDAHMDFVDFDLNQTVGLWRVQHSPLGAADPIKAQYGGIETLDGDGMDDSGDATAGHQPNILGRMRIEDLLAGSIPHALAVTIPKAAGLAVEYFLDKKLWLDMSASEIAALSVPDWKKMIYLAMARRGIIVVDYGGTSLMTLQYEAGSQYVDRGIFNPWLEWAKARAAAGEDFTHFGGDETYPATYEGSFEGDIDWPTKLKLIPAVTGEGEEEPDPDEEGGDEAVVALGALLYEAVAPLDQ